MEYIQCPHCQKKYGVSEKLRAATGKRIRCKHCQQTFAIFIQESINQATLNKINEQQHPESLTEKKEPEAQSEAEPQTVQKSESDKTTAKKKKKRSGKKGTNTVKKRAKKSLNIQLVIMIVLGTLLVVSGVGGYLYLYHPDLIRPETAKEQPKVNPEMNFKSVDPFAIKDKQPDKNQKKSEPKIESKIANEPLTPAKQAVKKQPSSTRPKAEEEKPAITKEREKSPQDGPENPTQVCKDAAADYWIRTHMISNAMLTNEAYMKLLNQGLTLTDEVRTRCKERELVARLAEAARNELAPDWIKPEIISRTTTKPDNQKAADSNF